MDKAGFVPGDPLYERVKKAHDAMHDLSVHVHYLVCETHQETLKLGDAHYSAKRHRVLCRFALLQIRQRGLNRPVRSQRQNAPGRQKPRRP